jgi:putative transposase
MKKPPPSVMRITKGATVHHLGRDYVVQSLVDMNLILAKEIGSEQQVLLQLDSLQSPRTVAPSEGPTPSAIDLESISQDDWDIAKARRAIIDPWITGTRQSRAEYKLQAEAAGISVATLYRWLSTYRNTGLLSSLLPNRRDGGQMKGRLSPEVETILKDCIENFHLTQQKVSVAATTVEVRRRCSNAGVPMPAATTVRRHIEWIDEQTRIKQREGDRVAKLRFDPKIGKIPDANWPLAIVQMDHTLLPVIIVDDEHRRPINRAWITLAIDVFSRMCVGMYLTLDPPSAMSAGMCVLHAIFPKNKWLLRLGMSDLEWPCYGVMDTLHMDNAREFRGDMLKAAGAEYDIDVTLRPVKKPHYGAHIERLMGTVSEELKSVRGATFSGPKEKGDYDAEGNACMTLSELEKWLVLVFARYHSNIHRGIGTTPLTKWREGIFGTKTTPGRGLQLIRLDEEKARMDFMPFEERTIQDYGVLLDKIYYYHDVLRPWINSRDPANPKLARLFRFRRDPRDISQLYFFDPDMRKYYAIPYRDSGLPVTSIWEWRETQKRTRDLGIQDYDERTKFTYLNRQRDLEADAAQKTKQARHAQQVKKEHRKARAIKNEIELPEVSNPTVSAEPPALPGYDRSKVRPLDDEY